MNCSFAFSSHKLTSIPKKTQFEKNPQTDWNSAIRGQAKLKNDQAILSTYTQMESLCIAPDSATLPLVFKACARLNVTDVGKRIHLRIKGTDLEEDVRVGTAIVDFYCKCGFLEDARNVYDAMSKRDVVLWNAMINGYVGSGNYEEAVFLFKEMQEEGLRPNSRTVVALLAVFEEVLDVRLGKAVHCYCLKSGTFYSDAHVGTALIGFYLSYDVRISQFVFDSMVLRNTVSWNAMITGYLDVGCSNNALSLFILMLKEGLEFDSVTMLVVVQACSQLGCLELGEQIHQIAIKFGYSKDLFIVNALLNMYCELGSLELACELFNSITTRDLALWNSMLSAYIKYACHVEAITLFDKFLKSGIGDNERTSVILLSLCTEIVEGLRVGESLHANAMKKGMKLDVFLGNALLDMYGEQNCLESARKVFRAIRNVDVVSYNTLIFCLARNKFRVEAWKLFSAMQESETKPNGYTIISILPVCEDENLLAIGRSIHGFAIKHGIEVNVSLNTALTDMYMRCGDVSAARNLFERCPDRDLISWNALIAGYIEKNQAEEALMLFNRMITEMKPNSVTIISILSACVGVSNLPLGKCLHAYMVRREPSLTSDMSVSNALIAMYARCGSMGNAEKIFRSLSRKSIITWNAIITCYGMHGRGGDAIHAFFQMLEDGFQPNGVTFLSALSACSHSGLAEKGLRLFQSMVWDFNIAPEISHCGCVVDMLGRAGHLDKAMEFIKLMPVEPDALVWRALLSACRDHCDTKLATIAFEKLVELDPMNAGNYVLLSNIYAEAGLWSEVRQIRTRFRDKDLKKPPGMSWTVVRGHIHSFVAADTSHPLSEKIYGVLSSLMSSIRQNGYAPDLCWTLYDD